MSSANILFGFMMLVGPVISITASNWILVWIGIELNFIGMIPLMFMGNKYSSMNKEASLKYFCVQALSSAIMFLAGLIYFMDYNFAPEIIFIFALCLKLGLFPGHFWVPSVISSMEWVPALLLLTWQKIPALVLVTVFSEVADQSMVSFLVILGGLSAVVGGFIGNNTTSVRAMIAASSISHTGWVILGGVAGGLWIYFVLYSAALMLCISLFREQHKLASISLLSLSGLPPFLMFVGKWSIISSALIHGMDFKFLLLPVLGTLLSLVFYLKFTYYFHMNKHESWSGRAFLSLVFLNIAGMLYLVVFFGDRS